MTTKHTPDGKNPWLGFQTYQEIDARRFKGRSKDIKDLYNLVKDNPIVVCYADSGIGKSSLINAGLCPLLKKEQLLPIKIEVAEDCLSFDDFSLDENIINRIEASINTFNQDKDNKESKVTIIVEKDPSLDDPFLKMMDNAINSFIIDEKNNASPLWAENETSETPITNTSVDKSTKCVSSLWWYLHTRVFFINISGLRIRLTPFLVFDQFEEVFHKAKSLKQTEKFFKWFRDFSMTTPTADVLRVYEEISNNTELRQKVDIPNANPLKSLFSLRREYMANLDYWTSQKMTFPSFQECKYCLMPLNKEQALEVITGQWTHRLDSLSEQIIYGLDPQGEAIPSIILSVVCHELYEISLKRNIEDKDLEFNNIILTAYNYVVNLKDKEKDERYVPLLKIEDIEELLTDSRGKRQQITLKESGLTTNEYIYLKKNNIIKDTASDDKIELVHDKLAEIVRDKVNNRLFNKAKIETEKEYTLFNRQELLNYGSVLSIGGRELIENYENFGGCDDERSSVFSAIMQIHANKGQRKLHNDLNKREKTITINVASVESGNKTEVRYISTSKSILDTFLFSNRNISDLTPLYQLLNDTNSRKNHICISYTDENGNPCHSLDGIYEIDVTIEEYIIVSKDSNGNEITETKPLPIQVIFFDKNRPQKVVNRYGFCGIKLIYDKKGNEIERIYIGEDNKPTATTKCYSIIKRTYNDDGLPVSTRYFDRNGNPCIMWDGNHGYNSHFNDYGQEDIRTFVGIDGEPIQLRNGVYGQEYQYESKLGLRKKVVTNLDNNYEACPDIKGYCRIMYFYDSKGRNDKQVFYDENSQVKDEECGYAIITYGYNDHDQISSIRYYDRNYIPAKTNEGIYGSILEYDDYERPVFVGFIDYLGNPMANNEGYSFIKRTFDSIGIEISSSFFDYRRQPTFNKDGIHKIGAFYNSHTKLLEKLENYDILDNIIEGKDEWAKQIVHWDAEGRNILKIELFKKTSSEPYFFVVFNYSDDDHTVEREEVDNGVSRKALFKKDFAKRDIYYQPLNYTIDNGAHHVIYTYDRFSRKLKTLFFADDGSPYKDEDGDSGIETIYNGTGQEVGYYSLNEMGHRHLNRNGFSSVKWNNTHEGFIQEYYDIDGITPIINTAYLCHKRLIEDGITKKCWDINGNLCDSAMGYAYVHEWREQGEGTNIYRGFFNSKSEPVMYEGWHKICQTTSSTNVLKSFLDINGNLVSPYGYAAKKEITKTGLTSTANSIVLYYDQNMLPCDGPNPCDDNDAILAHKWELKGDGNAKRVFRAITSNRKRVKGSLLSQYEIVLLWLLIPFITIYYLLYELLLKGVWNVIKKRFTKSKEYVRAIVVEEVFDDVQDLSDDANTDGIQSACNLYGVKKGDVLLEFGEWKYDYLSENVDKNIELFEKVFNESRYKQKNVTVARIVKRPKGLVTPVIIRFVALGNIGARLADRVDLYDDRSINLINKRLVEIKTDSPKYDGLEEDTTQKSNFLRTIAFTYKEEGVLDKAVAKYKEAIEQLGLSAKIRKLDLSQLYYELATCHQILGENDEAVANIKHAIDSVSQLKEGQYVLYLYQIFMVNNYIKEQNYVKAKDVCIEYMDFAKNYLTSVDLAQYYSRYSTILEALNDIQGSVINKQKAIEVYGKLDLAKEQSIAWHELSVIYAKQELYQEAEDSIRKAISLINDDSKQSNYYKEILHQYLYSQNKFEELIFTARNEGDLKVPIKIKEGITFAIWEWCDWNISQDRSLEMVLENNKDKRKHIVLFSNGTLVEFETEESTIGLHIQSQYFDRESKQSLISQYTNWLKNKNK